LIQFPIPAMDKKAITLLLAWYKKNKRDLPWRNTQSLYAIWVSEIMLQQTQVSTVIPYYFRFMSAFPTIVELARAPEDVVLKMWEGLGYYSRARNLHHAARKIQSEKNKKIPEDPLEFRKLPGVGPYITAAILSIGRGIPIPTVDGNVMRVFSRFNLYPEDIREPAAQKKIADLLFLVIPRKDPGNFNQAMMELGSQICKPKNPVCPSCPIRNDCQAYKNNKIEAYPVKTPRPRVPEYAVSIAVILRKNRFYIQKRPSKGHLGGLWEFPGGKAKPGEKPEQAVVRECFEELKVDLEVVQKLTSIKHAYTHFKIDMTVFLGKIAAGNSIQTNRHHHWITVYQINKFPFPGANHKFFPILRSYMRSNCS